MVAGGNPTLTMRVECLLFSSSRIGTGTGVNRTFLFFQAWSWDWYVHFFPSSSKNRAGNISSSSTGTGVYRTFFLSFRIGAGTGVYSIFVVPGLELRLACTVLFVLPGLELGLLCTELFCSSRIRTVTGVYRTFLFFQE